MDFARRFLDAKEAVVTDVKLKLGYDVTEDLPPQTTGVQQDSVYESRHLENPDISDLDVDLDRSDNSY